VLVINNARLSSKNEFVASSQHISTLLAIRCHEKVRIR